MDQTSERCGKPTGQHPTMAHLSGICAREPNHDGDCDNRLYKPEDDPYRRLALAAPPPPAGDDERGPA